MKLVAEKGTEMSTCRSASGEPELLDRSKCTMHSKSRNSILTQSYKKKEIIRAQKDWNLPKANVRVKKKKGTPMEDAKRKMEPQQVAWILSES